VTIDYCDVTSPDLYLRYRFFLHASVYIFVALEVVNTDGNDEVFLTGHISSLCPFSVNPPRSTNRVRISVFTGAIINVNHFILFSFRTLRPVWIRQPHRWTCDGYDGKTKSN